MYAQLIDDKNGVTLVSASTLEAPIKDELGYGEILRLLQSGTVIGAKGVTRRDKRSNF